MDAEVSKRPYHRTIIVPDVLMDSQSTGREVVASIRAIAGYVPSDYRSRESVHGL